MALSPTSDVQQREGEKALYSLDYERARGQFQKLIEIEPDNPYAYLMDAAGIWWQASNEYGLLKDTPTLEGRFEGDIEKALGKASTIEKSSSDAQVLAEQHFIQGMALGARGQWQLLRGRWIKAYRDGKRAVKHLNQCLKLDPDFYDAYLGLGVYDYQAANLPTILRISSFLMVRGNAPRGLRRLHLAYERGRHGSVQAALFLITIYMAKTDDPSAALTLIQEMKSRFPDSPYFLFLEIIALHHLGRFDASYQAALSLFRQASKDSSILGRKQLSIICGVYGEDCLNGDSLPRTLDWLIQALQAANQGGPRKKSAKYIATSDALANKSQVQLSSNVVFEGAQWRTLLYFYTAITQDLLGRRESAVKNYNESLALPNIADIHALCRRCVETACTRREVLAMLKAKSL